MIHLRSLVSRDPVSVEMQWRVRNTFVHVDEEEVPEAEAGWSPRLTRSRSDSSLPLQTGGESITAPRDQSTRIPIDETTTTAMLDIGQHMSLEELVALLDEKGLNGAYDFAYIPGGFRRRQSKSIGYAVVNFVTAKDLQRARSVLKARSNHLAGTCIAFSAFRLQGLEALMARYQDSEMLRSGSVEDKFKPALFQEGRRIVFPAPATNDSCGGRQQAVRRPRKRQNRNGQRKVQRL